MGLPISTCMNCTLDRCIQIFGPLQPKEAPRRAIWIWHEYETLHPAVESNDFLLTSALRKRTWRNWWAGQHGTQTAMRTLAAFQKYAKVIKSRESTSMVTVGHGKKCLPTWGKIYVEETSETLDIVTRPTFWASLVEIMASWVIGASNPPSTTWLDLIPNPHKLTLRIKMQASPDHIFFFFFFFFMVPIGTGNGLREEALTVWWLFFVIFVHFVFWHFMGRALWMCFLDLDSDSLMLLFVSRRHVLPTSKAQE